MGSSFFTSILPPAAVLSKWVGFLLGIGEFRFDSHDLHPTTLGGRALKVISVDIRLMAQLERPGVVTCSPVLQRGIPGCKVAE